MNKFYLPIIALAFILTSCFDKEDPGPLQSQQQEFFVSDFDRVEVGDALQVNIEQSESFQVKVNGDRRNIQDLEVQKIGNTLRIRFKESKRVDYRQYHTYITISMPEIHGASFSGGVSSVITGFNNNQDLALTLSGASTSSVSIAAGSIKAGMSGASRLNISGRATLLDAVVTGASEFRGFDLEASKAVIDASGASKVRVLATQNLKATASGASDIRYRGTPTISSSVSGASSIMQD